MAYVIRTPKEGEYGFTASNTEAEAWSKWFTARRQRRVLSCPIDNDPVVVKSSAHVIRPLHESLSGDAST